MRKSTLLAAAAALGLAGCACPPQEPRVEYKEVKVPVAVPCLTGKPVKPKYEVYNADLSDGDTVLVLTRNWLASRVYEAALEAELAGCTKK